MNRSIFIFLMLLAVLSLPCIASHRITVTVHLPKGDDSTKVTVYAQHHCNADTLLPKSVKKNTYTFYIGHDMCFIATSDTYRPEVIHTIPVGNDEPQDLHIYLKKKKTTSGESEAEYINRMLREFTAFDIPASSTIHVSVDE